MAVSGVKLFHLVIWVDSFFSSASAKSFLDALLGQNGVVSEPKVPVQGNAVLAALQFGIDRSSRHTDFFGYVGGSDAFRIHDRDRLSVLKLDRSELLFHCFTFFPRRFG